jgi:ATP-dependent exoDNAse (exonuclease V) beta subunit
MLPEWLFALGNLVRYVEPPSHHRFSVNDPATEATLRGVADGISLMKDVSYTIVDYKTAKYTKGQAALLPIYRAQLNGYAYIRQSSRVRPGLTVSAHLHGTCY